LYSNVEDVDETAEHETVGASLQGYDEEGGGPLPVIVDGVVVEAEEMKADGTG